MWRPPGGWVVVESGDLLVTTWSTGDVVVSLADEAGVIGWDVVDGDLVVTSITSDASVTITRMGLGAGEEVWTYRSDPGVVPGDDAPLWSHRTGPETLQVEGDVTIAVSLETGLEIPPDEVTVLEMNVGRAILPDGTTVEVRHDQAGFGAEGRVLDEDGSVRFEFVGSPWWLSRTDGSAPEVFVVQGTSGAGESDGGTRLVGLDAATGAELWTVSDADGYGVLQIDGLALVAGSRIGVIDIRTGRWMWERPADQAVFVAPLTDGELVLLPARGGWVGGLVAVDLRTGEEAWRMPLPDGVVDADSTRDGTLLLMTETELIAYR